LNTQLAVTPTRIESVERAQGVLVRLPVYVAKSQTYYMEGILLLSRLAGIASQLARQLCQ